jgi:hypothetical protein
MLALNFSGFHYQSRTKDMSATIRNATPARKRLPVRNQTMNPIMAAGRTNRRASAIRTIMRSPMKRRTANRIISNRPPGKAGILIIGKIFSSFKERLEPQLLKNL